VNNQQTYFIHRKLKFYSDTQTFYFLRFKFLQFIELPVWIIFEGAFRKEAVVPIYNKSKEKHYFS